MAWIGLGLALAIFALGVLIGIKIHNGFVNGRR